MKRYSTSLLIEKCKLKSLGDTMTPLSEWVTLERLTILSTGEVVGQMELYSVEEMSNDTTIFEK